MLEICPDLVVAGARLETNLKCWSLQQHMGDLATIQLGTGNCITKVHHAHTGMKDIAARERRT